MSVEYGNHDSPNDFFLRRCRIRSQNIFSQKQLQFPRKQDLYHDSECKKNFTFQNWNNADALSKTQKRFFFCGRPKNCLSATQTAFSVSKKFWVKCSEKIPVFIASSQNRIVDPRATKRARYIPVFHKAVKFTASKLHSTPQLFGLQGWPGDEDNIVFCFLFCSQFLRMENWIECYCVQLSNHHPLNAERILVFVWKPFFAWVQEGHSFEMRQYTTPLRFVYMYDGVSTQCVQLYFHEAEQTAKCDAFSHWSTFSVDTNLKLSTIISPNQNAHVFCGDKQVLEPSCIKQKVSARPSSHRKRSTSQQAYANDGTRCVDTARKQHQMVCTKKLHADLLSRPVWTGPKTPETETCVEKFPKAQFTQDAWADLRANLHANPLMLCATCVNTPICRNVSHCFRDASRKVFCVNGASKDNRELNSLTVGLLPRLWNHSLPNWTVVSSLPCWSQRFHACFEWPSLFWEVVSCAEMDGTTFPGVRSS